MTSISIKKDAGLLTLAIRLVVGWTYFSALWRRTILADKLDPEQAGYIGESCIQGSNATNVAFF